MTKIEKYLAVGVLIAIVIAIASFGRTPKATDTGVYAGIGSNTNFYSLQTDAGITSGGTLTVTTTNTATSTAKFGCIQGVATSTATPIHFELSTTTALATYSGGTAITSTVGGVVAWRYGACPV